MIYVTVTTYNRFWHSALTALCIAQTPTKGLFINVLDDASDDEFQEAKYHLFNDMKLRGLIHRYDIMETRQGFCAGRKLLVDRFLEEPRFTHWFHLDDDILVSQKTIHRSMQDIEGPLERKGLLHVYVNPWCEHKSFRAGFDYVTKIGGAAFIVPKTIMEDIPNPYADQTDGEKANAGFWRSLAKSGHPMFIRKDDPYLCQHTGNVESTIFGMTPKWEHLYAQDLRTKTLIEVPPFDMNELRQAIKSSRLSTYVWRKNMASKIQIQLPAPGSQRGVNFRQ